MGVTKQAGTLTKRQTDRTKFDLLRVVPSSEFQTCKFGKFVSATCKFLLDLF